MRTHSCVLLAFTLLAGAGCAPNQEPLGAMTPGIVVPGSQALPSEVTATMTAAPASTRTLLPAATATVSTATAFPASAVPPDLLGLPEVEQAKADLAVRLSVSPDEIEVVTVQPMTWSDSSMGCPQPDMAYLQVLVDGLLVQLSHAGQMYNYHSGGGQPPFLCEQTPFGEKPAPVLDANWLTPAGSDG